MIGYNLYYFNHLTGGQAELEALHPTLHGVNGPWSGDFLEGAAGTLVSPSRGLFIFTPWAALALGLAPWSARRLKTIPLVPWVLWGLLPYFLLLSQYAVWWAGFCFGPRYWTDAIPLLAILLACGLAWSRSRSPLLRLAFTLTILFSFALQALGAWFYPSSWNLLDAHGSPANIDTHHERLWDWSDSELTRILRDKILRPNLHPGH